jgi:hypothetical protein
MRNLDTVRLSVSNSIHENWLVVTLRRKSFPLSNRKHFHNFSCEDLQHLQSELVDYFMLLISSHVSTEMAGHGRMNYKDTEPFMSAFF